MLPPRDVAPQPLLAARDGPTREHVPERLHVRAAALGQRRKPLQAPQQRPPAGLDDALREALTLVEAPLQLLERLGRAL